MKIILVQPRPKMTRDYKSKSGTTFIPPLGIMYLASFLKDRHDVSLIDGNFHLLSNKDLASKIVASEPDIVGISLNYTPQLAGARGITREIKAIDGNKFIVFGGNCATFMAPSLIQDPAIDSIILHEGEKSFTHMVDCLEKGLSLHEVSGILFKENGGVVSKPFTSYINDLDELPFPDFDLLDEPERYKMTMITSRGCPYHCVYCSTRAMWGKWRPRSAENVFSEFHQLTEKFTPDKISFADDIFPVSYQRVEKFVRLLKESGIKTKWGFSTRIEYLNERIVELVNSAGCTNIYLGVESGSNRVLQALDRGYTIEEALKKVDLCIANGIIPIVSFMVGIPGETKEDALMSIEALEKANTPYVQMSIFRPLTGTPVFLKPDDHKVTIDDFDMERTNFDDGFVYHETEFLSKQEIFELWERGKGIIQRRARESYEYEQTVYGN